VSRSEILRTRSKESLRRRNSDELILRSKPSRSQQLKKDVTIMNQSQNIQILITMILLMK